MSTLIHGDNYLTDISPLPQIIAIIILAISSIMLIYIITNNEKITFWNIIAVIPLGLSPYFLECLSYKYDAPYMALSMLGSIFPFLFKNHNKYLYIIICIIGTILMCTTYQSSSGIFLIILILLCLKEWNKGEKVKDILKFFMKSIVGFTLGLLIFKIFILSMSTGAYKTYGISPINEIIPNAIKNICQYYTYIFSDFKSTWIILITVSLIAFLYKTLKETKNKKVISFIVTICSLFLMSILCFGVYPTLKSPLFNPRAMYGFGVFVAIIQIYATNFEKMYFEKISCLILAWLFIVFSFTYGNALSTQKQYTDFRISMVINDLNELEMFNNKNTKNVKIIGDIGKAPIINNMPDNYNILNRLIPNTFSGFWHWGKYYFYNYFALKNVKWNDRIDEDSNDILIIKDTMYHTIKANENNVVIILK